MVLTKLRGILSRVRLIGIKDWFECAFRPGGFWFNTVFILLAATVAGIGTWIAVNNWEWLQTASIPFDEDGSPESNSTTLRNVGLLIGGLLALVFALWRSLVAGHQADTSRRQAEVAQSQIEIAQQQAKVAQQSLLHERYQKGAEMLSSEILSVRLGGIYALQRLLEEDPDQYYLQIMELFCAFIRFPTKSENAEGQLNSHPYGWPLEPREDINPIVDIIRTRSEKLIALEKKGDFTLKLHQSEMPRANFISADLSRATMRDTNLHAAFLEKADLSGTNLPRSDLSQAHLKEARLSSATLWRVNLAGAELWGADMTGAILNDANVSGAKFVCVNPHSRRGMPSVGLTQAQLDVTRADPDNLPILEDVLDAETGLPLVWRGKTLSED